MSDQLPLMIELLQRSYEAITPLEQVVHDVPNSNHKDHYMFINNPELDCNVNKSLESETGTN
ncbi:hypothetical protein PVK06_025548 [Gossypium arboreum]|uniref:Uncharacterized protein n=1 Tax=Gossypium arboreum TaxID=29729 RepID=A0ABR0PGV0_GOSAR|nr:hypothetical protein PVK06_025548 [Gossypium arboreum]